MPNFELSQQPQYPIMTLDTDTPIDKESLKKYFSKSKGITLCVRSKTGHENRGGYFFSMKKAAKDSFILETIEGEYVDTLPLDKMVRYINHATGLKFDKEILSYCQNEVNFKND